MFIRRVDIQNYRGIKRLHWVIPRDQNFICLIGPGDSAKSSILEAVYLALCERWTLSLSDTDFFDSNVDDPIVIRVALTDLTDEILSHQVLGFELSGIKEDGELLHDPVADSEICVIIQLMITADLEPRWCVYRPGGEEPFAPAGTGIRRKLAVFKVGERIDNHLRWTKVSALGRMTEAEHGTAGTLAAATRASRQAVSGALSPQLKALTDTIQAKLHQVGSGRFEDLRPGLDTSVPSSNGLLALFEGNIPLTNFGLGSRRLAGIATQQLAYSSKTIQLVDEVEYGLEPHRLVHLLTQLRDPETTAQVFVTTHSPVAVEQLYANDFAAVRNNDGQVTIRMLRNHADIQGLLRRRPSAFLARRIILAEGRTEYGLLLGMLDRWNSERSRTGEPTSSALGVAVVDGEGGVQAAQRAQTLIAAGYEVVLFIDNDDRGADKEMLAAEAQGCQIVRWSHGKSTEQQLIEDLDPAALTSLLTVAVETRSGAATVRQDLAEIGSIKKVESLDVEAWISSSDMSLDEARLLISKTAIRRKWFKGVEYGKQVAAWIIEHPEFVTGSQFAKILDGLRCSLYQGARSADDGMASVGER